jgi:hypothetical protein
VIYLCADNFLIDQTCEQAKQFGIATCTAHQQYHPSSEVIVREHGRKFVC